MKFEYLQFRGKEVIRRDMIHDIKQVLETKLDTERVSELAVENYLEILLDGSDYDIKTRSFYHDILREPLDKEFFASVAHDYISDNINDFILEIYKI